LNKKAKYTYAQNKRRLLFFMASISPMYRVYNGNINKRSVWGILSNELPVSVDGMYRVISRNHASSVREKNKYMSVGLTPEARRWKQKMQHLAALTSPSKPFLGEGPYCSFLFLGVFANNDTDNRLKILNDSLEKTVISNDKRIKKSLQYKTIVRKQVDIGYFFLISQRANFSFLFQQMEILEKKVEQGFEDTHFLATISSYIDVLFSEMSIRISNT
jgi:hypothetical protein